MISLLPNLLLGIFLFNLTLLCIIFPWLGLFILTIFFSMGTSILFLYVFIRMLLLLYNALLFILNLLGWGVRRILRVFGKGNTKKGLKGRKKVTWDKERMEMDQDGRVWRRVHEDEIQ